MREPENAEALEEESWIQLDREREERFRCICDPTDLFEPPDPTPRAVEGCPAHRARRAAQLFTERA